MTDVRRIHIPEHVIPGKRLGRHAAFDPRSRDYRVTTPQPVHSQSWTRTVKAFDQGNLGSCTGNGTEGALATQPLRQAGHRYSETQAVTIYKKATQLDGFDGTYPPDDTGSTVLAAMKAAQALGKITGYLWALGIDDALAGLANKGPLVVGVNWYEGFDNPDVDGNVSISGQVRGGHCFEIRSILLGPTGGLDDTVLTAVNSWGTSWGVHGEFRFTARTLARLLEHDGEAAIPVRV